MPEPARAPAPETPLLADLPALAAAAAEAAGALVAAARARLAARVVQRRPPLRRRARGGPVRRPRPRLDGDLRRAPSASSPPGPPACEAAGRLGETERLILQIGAGEYLAQLAGGIPMSQVEIARPDPSDLAAFRTPAVQTLIAHGNTDAARARLVELMLETQGAASFGATGLDADDEMIRDQFRRFADERVVPFAHGWHRKDELIPLAIIEEMGALGVFGLTIPEEYGGSGLSKTAMCVVSEELSRGYIGVGSLGTRSEIAAELILGGGTEAQKAEWLPKLASAEILPTAVFTEPNTGSDLGALRTRAARDGEDYVVTGNKTWITHAARADLMTMLVRTDPATTDHTGLSMLLAPKPRGTEADPFPAPGMTGGEIEVLGYRGMKEYELAFDAFRVPAGEPPRRRRGPGLQAAHAHLRVRPHPDRRPRHRRRPVRARARPPLRPATATSSASRSIAFPRVYSKLAMMAVEIMIARQLTYFAAREKDAGRRCDLEAGMAKLLAARIAWSNADNALQIHGGNGFALEYPISRVLCDARILSIFEGAAEIQAQVIARRLLEPRPA